MPDLAFLDNKKRTLVYDKSALFVGRGSRIRTYE